MSDAVVDDLVSFGKRLESLHPGESTLQFAKRIGESDTTIGNYERGVRTPKADFLARLRERTGVDLNWLISGVGPQSEHVGLGADQLPEFALLPRYSVSASAGSGLVALEEQEIERIAFRRDWLHEMGIDAREAGLVTASGDSMDPTIPDGAMMLVVRRHGEPIRSGFIYVLVLDGEVLVKRIMRNVDGTFDLISDNPLYPVQKVRQVDLDGLHIAGRVFWVGRRI